METGPRPEDFSYPCIVFCEEHGNRVYAQERERTLDDYLENHRYGSKYGYAYGEIIGIAERHETFTTFSHWYIPSGGSSNSAQAIWHSMHSYTILKRFRVGRKGILKPLD